SVVPREAAVGEKVAVRMAYRLGGRRAAGEVALAAGVAPGPLRVPMPGLDVQLGVLAIGDGLPAGRQYVPDEGFGEELVGRRPWDAIDAGAQGALGNEAVRLVARRNVDAHRVGGVRRRRCAHAGQQ